MPTSQNIDTNASLDQQNQEFIEKPTFQTIGFRIGKNKNKIRQTQMGAYIYRRKE